MTTAFDLTCRQTRQATSRSRHSASSGWRRLATVIVERSVMTRSRRLDEQSAVDAAHVERLGARWPVHDEDADPRLGRELRGGLVVDAGTHHGFEECLASSVAVARSMRRLIPTMPPNADRGSHSYARRYASHRGVADRETARVGVLDHARGGLVELRTSARAASTSSQFVNDSADPCNWRA